MSEIKITVDGPAGSGKSSVAQLVSKALVEAGLRVSIEGRVTMRDGPRLETSVSSIAKTGLMVRIIERHPDQGPGPVTGIEGIDA